MTIAVDVGPLVDLVRETYSRVADDACQSMLLDMNANGPRSDRSDHEHMVDRVELTGSEDSDTTISRTIHSPADYSSYVDEGTEPHRIEGHPLLAFTAKDGTRVVVRYVNHPGTARTGWWSDTVARYGDYLRQAM